MLISHPDSDVLTRDEVSSSGVESLHGFILPRARARFARLIIRLPPDPPEGGPDSHGLLGLCRVDGGWADQAPTSAVYGPDGDERAIIPEPACPRRRLCGGPYV
ncbi:hypothetical protein Psi02_04390 [Planotetraspora silvatica]|uniref:Uncharacterized protein n=1 Tax=Planotetraspora silvatica TaxID=234614 RepID=A0A8J3XK98_9ACTN|nr:hypothetical protein Psi02_04390 [Planotetraspora silvatica]